MSKHNTVGFGVFQIPPEDTARAVAEAIEAGYRHIDTAQSYFNEAEVGEGIRLSGIDRNELHVTTKVWLDHFGEGPTLESIHKSLDKLGLDHVDELLLHQPFGDIFGAWRDMEKAYHDGLASSIGVSNFAPYQVHNLGSFSDIYPMVNQIEINPFYQRTDRVVELQKHDVAVEAWAPFAEGKAGLFSNPVLTTIGQKYGKSPAQVTLRWLLQRGITPLAKSVHGDRMKQNLDVFDFELTEADMTAIAGLDTASSQFFNHESTAVVDRMVALVAQLKN